uniref:Uncharacterized protein n=1 Tax=Timema shepardi TaxID=629360 RepID=A0A7R9FXG5_TIMSH|nr:unnamed protein product [Timema shepardi]
MTSALANYATERRVKGIDVILVTTIRAAQASLNVAPPPRPANVSRALSCNSTMTTGKSARNVSFVVVPVNYTADLCFLNDGRSTSGGIENLAFTLDTSDNLTLFTPNVTIQQRRNATPYLSTHSSNMTTTCSSFATDGTLRRIHSVTNLPTHSPDLDSNSVRMLRVRSATNLETHSTNLVAIPSRNLVFTAAKSTIDRATSPSLVISDAAIPQIESAINLSSFPPEERTMCITQYNDDNTQNEVYRPSNLDDILEHQHVYECAEHDSHSTSSNYSDRDEHQYEAIVLKNGSGAEKIEDGV